MKHKQPITDLGALQAGGRLFCVACESPNLRHSSLRGRLAPGEPHFFKWKTLGRYCQKGVENIRCENSLLEVNVQALLGEFTDRPHEWGIGHDLPDESAAPPRAASGAPESAYKSNVIAGIVWWGVLALTVYLFAVSEIEKFYLIAFLVAFVLTFTIIITFTLVDRKRLSGENLITILKMSFAKIPGLKWLDQ